MATRSRERFVTKPRVASGCSLRTRSIRAAKRLLARLLEWARFSGHLRACAREARKDGVRRAQNPARISEGVPRGGRAVAARRSHAARALSRPRRVRADAQKLAPPGATRSR